uniref:Uncharacterized protein MLCB637.05c n=1 Tax=Mycobacterium leprae TaxID=1769 RepID=O33097_MYCLR|nr:hypothetical protein MLCB637.05c [Mycobacterium leprae]
MRATIAMVGTLNISARATKDPGNVEPIAKTFQLKHVAADHQDSAQTANRASRHRGDSDAESAQHQPAIGALRVRPTQQRFILTHTVDIIRCPQPPSMLTYCGSAL